MVKVLATKARGPESESPKKSIIIVLTGYGQASP